MPNNPMNITPPTPEVTEGPAWAEQINDILTDNIAEHDHTTNKGVQITPAALNLNSDVDLQENNLTSVRSVRLQDQASAIGSQDDVGCLYEVNGDLYYNSGDGDQVPITAGGSLAATSFGGINGLPNGTAQVGYANDTYTFKKSSTDYAIMDTGDHKIRSSADTAPATGITIKAPQGLPASYDLTLPSQTPSTPAFMTLALNGTIGTSILTTNGITRNNMAAVGQSTHQIPTISGLTGGWLDVPNSSFSFTSIAGRPVFLSIQSNPNAGPAFPSSAMVFTKVGPASPSTFMQIRVVVDGVPYTAYTFAGSGTNSFYYPLHQLLLGVSAGSHTIKLQYDQVSATSVALSNVWLVAYEL